MTTVTLQGIRDKIKGATYTLLPNGRTTVCQLTLENGFTVEGQSACVDAATYNQGLGEKYAYEDALNNCWKFEGYLLAEKLWSGRQQAQDSDPTGLFAGQRAYRAFYDHGMFGGFFCSWDDQPDDEQARWISAAKAA